MNNWVPSGNLRFAIRTAGWLGGLLPQNSVKLPGPRFIKMSFHHAESLTGIYSLPLSWALRHARAG
jgi:hypothetical protein